MDNSSQDVNVVDFTLQQHNFPQVSSNQQVNSSSTQNSVFSFNQSTTASSAPNSDEEDSDDRNNVLVYKDRRREAHTHAEQKRRDAIKRGYEELQLIVPTCASSSDALTTQKLSKATILQRSIDYITYLVQQKKKQQNDLESLRKEVMALNIMKANYEHIVKANESIPHCGQNQLSDEVKFKVFQQIADTLFQSFNASISVANFSELSSCVFGWLEQYCKPQTLREITLGILRQLNSQLMK